MAREQGSQAGAKEDTIFLSYDSGGLDIDVSQNLTNLTASGNGGYETTSARAALITTRTISARWTATAGELNKALIVHGKQDQADYTYALVTDGTGTICGKQNGSPIWSAGAVVKAKEYVISWSLRPNPDTTGAADAMISEYIVYNVTDATLEAQGQEAHVAPTTDVTWDLSIAGWWTGGGGFIGQPTNAPVFARVSSSHHPNVEVWEDWIAARTAYVGTAADGIVEPVGPRPIASGLGDSGQFAGRSHWAYAAATTKATAPRSWSLLVNEVLTDADAVTAEPARWRMLAPGDSDYTLSIQWLRWVAVPAEATHAWVRVHTSSSTVLARSLRVYAFNRPPGLTQIGNVEAPALVGFNAQVDWTGVVGTVLEWHELGYVRLPKFTGSIPGWTDTVHLCLAYSGSSFTVDAWSARPARRFVPGGIVPVQ